MPNLSIVKSTSSSPSLSVIVMAYNEAATLENVVGEIDQVARKSVGEHEIIIVDDGSTDGTEKLADRLMAEMPCVRVLHHANNQGIGAVLRTGYYAAKKDLVVVFPADGQCPASSIKDFVAIMADHDMVLAYIPKRNNPPLAIILSKIERMLFHVLFGPMPKFQGIYMFRRSLLDRFPLTSTGRGWIIQMELIIRAIKVGGRITSVPVENRDRISGKSKVTNFRSVMANAKQVVTLYWSLQSERFSSRRNEG